MKTVWLLNRAFEWETEKLWPEVTAVDIQWQDFSIKIWEQLHIHLESKKITLTKDFIEQTWWGDIQRATIMYYYRTMSQLMSHRKHEQYLITSVLYASDVSIHKHMNEMLLHADPLTYSSYFQAFIASVYYPHCVSIEVQEILETPIPQKDGTSKTFSHRIRTIGASLVNSNLLQEYYDKLGKSGISWTTSTTPSSSTLLQKLHVIGRDFGIRNKLEEVEKNRRQLLHKRVKQDLQSEKKKQEKNEGKEPKIQFDTTTEKQDSYNPRDSIRDSGESADRTVKDSWEVPITGYIKKNSMQVFNNHTLTWSSKDIAITQVETNNQDNSTHIHTVRVSWAWRYEYNIPYEYKPVSIGSWATLLQNQSGDYTLHVTNPWEIHIWLVQTTQQPIDWYEYTQSLFQHLPQEIEWFLSSYKTPHQKLDAIKNAILKKIYSTEYQGTIVAQSNSPDAYIANLWNAPKLECYSANHLFVALARHLGFEAKLSVWYSTRFVHEGKSYITTDDGHAWSELKVAGKWQIVDVTPTTQEQSDDSDSPNEPQDDQWEDAASQHNDFATLDQVLSEQKRKKLQEQLLRDSSSLPYEVKVLHKEWISITAAKEFYNRINKMKWRALKLADKLKKLFEDERYEEQIHYRHTTSQQVKIDLQKILTEEPSALVWDQEALVRLQKNPFYIKKQKNYIEKKIYPDEIILTCAIDVSWSMDDHQKTTKDYITLLWLTFAQLYSVMKKHWTQVKMECYGFGSSSKKYSLGETDDMITLNMDTKTMTWLAKLFAKIPDGMQIECGWWNAENDFYKKLIMDTYISPTDRENQKKNIVRLWISCTDQTTLTDTNESDGTDMLLYENSVLKWKNKHQRLSDLLYYLKEKCHLPMIALNTANDDAVKDSWYNDYLSANEKMDDKLYQKLEKLLKPENTT